MSMVCEPPGGASRRETRAIDVFQQVRRTTVALSERLSAEDQMVQSMADASPTKWHLAHTTWFFETFLLLPKMRRYKPMDPRFTFLFNSYYKQLGGHPTRSTRGAFSRPSLEEVMAYRRNVDAAMETMLSGSAVDGDFAALLELGINHEQQHQELIVTDIKHAFWTNPLRPAYRDGASTTAASEVPMSWVEFEGGMFEVGHDGRGFSFDNELPRHAQHVNRFRLASRLVTNAEYLRFIEDGGYRRPELWLSDAWDHIGANGWDAPLYWEQRDGERMVFTAAGMKRLALEEPVCHVSLYEADAYARWAGARLPREAEWEFAARTVEEPGLAGGNFMDSGRFHPSPAEERDGLQQMFGDVWEWTSSSYGGYPGYRSERGVLGEYNGKFMCNQMVLRGGSCATPASHIRASYRNFFPPHARWQFMGIRLANDCA